MSETAIFNNTIVTVNKIWHVAPSGNDTTGDGTAGNPYASPSKAINSSVTGDGIYIHAGSYRLTPINVSSYSAAGILDLGKKLFIWGDNKQTQLNFYGADTTRRDSCLFYCTNAATIVTNLSLSFSPNKSANYSNAIFIDCPTGTLFYNIVVNIPSDSPSLPSYSYNNTGGKPTVMNSILNSAVDFSTSYSSTITAINCLLSSSQTSGITKTNCLVRTITDDDQKLPVVTDCLHTGSSSVLNPNGSVSNIGLFGGPYAWAIYAIRILVKTPDGHYYSHQTGSWVDLGIPSDQSALLTFFQNSGDKICPQQSDLAALGSGIKICYWVDSQDGYLPNLSVIAIPNDQFIYATGDIDLKLCSNIDWFHTNDGTTGFESGNGKLRHVVSRDSGVTWYAYDGSAWNKIIDTTDPADGTIVSGRFVPSATAMDRIINQGMTKTQFDAASWQSWLINDGYIKVRFGYGISMAASTDVAFADNLKYQYDGQGVWKVAVNGVDYEARFDNLSLTLKWLIGGWRAKVNY